MINLIKELAIPPVSLARHRVTYLPKDIPLVKVSEPFQTTS